MMRAYKCMCDLPSCVSILLWIRPALINVVVNLGKLYMHIHVFVHKYIYIYGIRNAVFSINQFLPSHAFRDSKKISVNCTPPFLD